MAKHIVDRPVISWSPDGLVIYTPNSPTLVEVATANEAALILGSGRHVTLAISQGAAFCRGVRLPDVPAKELAQIVAVQTAQTFQVAGELCSVYRPSQNKDGEGRLVGVVATRTATIRDAHAALQAAGINPKSTTAATLGAATLATAHHFSDAVVVEKTPAGLTIDVIQSGVPVYSRIAPNVETERAINAEITRACMAAGMSQVPVLAAGGLQLASATQTTNERVLEAVSVVAPTEEFELPEIAIKKERAIAGTRIRVAALAALVAGVYGFLVWAERDDLQKVVNRKSAHRKRDLQALERAKSKESTATAAIATLASKMTESFGPAQRAYDVITEAGNAITPEIWLTGINFERGKPLQLRGTAVTNEAVSTYLTALSQSDRFRDVSLVFANNGKIDKTEVVNFSISLHVIGNLPLYTAEKKGARQK